MLLITKVYFYDESWNNIDEDFQQGQNKSYSHILSFKKLRQLLYSLGSIIS